MSPLFSKTAVCFGDKSSLGDSTLDYICSILAAEFIISSLSFN